jgi:predicted nucleic acid-binding protein
LKGFLLDTNHVSAWIEERPTFMERSRGVPSGSPVRVCSITLGELEWGHLVTTTSDEAKREKHRKFVINRLYPFAYSVTRHSGDKYAEILRRIWEKHRPRPKIGTQRHLSDLGVDVNDVWIVAVAWEHNLTLLTNDRMPVLREVVGNDVEFDSWC